MQEVVQLAKKKSDLSARDMLIRGILAGAFLAYATSLVFIVSSQGLAPIVGAILILVGFVMLVLLGLELVTGTFALLSAGVMAETVRVTRLLRDWGCVYFGNLIGSLLSAVLFYLVITNWRIGNGGAVADLLKQATQKKTLAYADLGLQPLGHRAGKGRSLQLDGDHGSRVGPGLEVYCRKDRRDVASNHDVFRPRLRALRGQHVPHSFGNDARRAHLPWPAVDLESASRNNRQSGCWNGYYGHGALCDVSHCGNSSRPSGTSIDASTG
jgi:hypothetical protein